MATACMMVIFPTIADAGKYRSGRHSYGTHSAPKSSAVKPHVVKTTPKTQPTSSPFMWGMFGWMLGSSANNAHAAQNQKIAECSELNGEWREDHCRYKMD